MFKDSDIKNLCDALKTFKSPFYFLELDEALKNKKNMQPNDISEDEYTLHVFREVISRFLIDVYDILDRATKDISNEKDIDEFWTSARKHLEESMAKWAEECHKKYPQLKVHFEQILEDLAEFQERAMKFHKERQLFSLSLRNKIMKQEIKAN